MTETVTEASKFMGTTVNPFHLSVGAIVRDAQGAYVLFRKDGLHAFMTETVENGESLEDAVARGLTEEMGGSARLIRYCGSTVLDVTDYRGTWQKTVLWFECALIARGGPSDIPDWEIVHLADLSGLTTNDSRWPHGLL